MHLNFKFKQIISSATILIVAVLLTISAKIISEKVFINSRLIGEEMAKLDKRNLSTENLRGNLSLVKEIGQTIESYDQYFFTQGQELKLITDLENIAAKHKMSQKIAASNLDNYADNRVDLAINLTGSYANLLKYLADLEAYQNIIAIQKIEFQPIESSASNSSELATLTRIQISLYVNPQITH